MEGILDAKKIGKPPGMYIHSACQLVLNVV